MLFRSGVLVLGLVTGLVRMVARPALVLPVPVPRMVMRVWCRLGQIFVGFGHGTAPRLQVAVKGFRRLAWVPPHSGSVLKASHVTGDLV